MSDAEWLEALTRLQKAGWRIKAVSSYYSLTAGSYNAYLPRYKWGEDWYAPGVFIRWLALESRRLGYDYPVPGADAALETHIYAALDALQAEAGKEAGCE